MCGESRQFEFWLNGGRNKKTQPWREATGTIIYLHERRREGGATGLIKGLEHTGGCKLSNQGSG